MSNLSAEELDFVDEVARNLRELSRMLTAYDLDDPVLDLTRTWAIYLTILCSEVYESVILLVHNGKRRTAWGLSRSLIEYWIRLQYYVNQAEEVVADWRTNGTYGPPDLRETHAYRDLLNANQRMIDNMKKWPDFDLTGLTPDQEAAFAKEMSEPRGRFFKQNWADAKKQQGMLDKVIVNNPAYRDYIDAEYGLRGTYVHGDQLGAYEVLYLGTNTTREPNFEARYSASRVVSYATIFAIRLMGACEDATGRQYAARSLDRMAQRVFKTK